MKDGKPMIRRSVLLVLIAICILLALFAAAVSAVAVSRGISFQNALQRITARIASCFPHFPNETDIVEIPSFIERRLLPKNPYSRPGTELPEIRGVVVHYVGNPNTSAAANRAYFESLAHTGETYASSHFIIDMDGGILQCVPLGEIAYCSNERNADTVSIECCHPDETGAFTEETYRSLVRLCAWLCETFSLDAKCDVIRHYDVTGKLCPLYFVEREDAWLAFLEEVETYRLEEHDDT